MTLKERMFLPLTTKILTMRKRVRAALVVILYLVSHQRYITKGFYYIKTGNLKGLVFSTLGIFRMHYIGKVHTDTPPIDRNFCVQSKPPIVSVIIPCYNYGQFLKNAVDSVLRQSYKNVEVIIVDGGSDDKKVFESINDPRVQKISQPARTLVGANRNAGISIANGDLVMCLDADDVLHQTYIEKALLFIFQGYDVVGSWLQEFGLRERVVETISTPTRDDMLFSNFVFTHALFRKEVWEELNGFRDFGLGKEHIPEDWDFWMRAALRGYAIFNIPEPLLLYRVHGAYSLSAHPEIMPFEKQRKNLLKLNREIKSQNTKNLSRNVSYNSNLFVGNIETRVIFIAVPFLIVGGAEKLLSILTKELSIIGWRVYLICTHDASRLGTNSESWFTSENVFIFNLPRFMNQNYWQDTFFQLINNQRPEILLICGSKFCYDSLPAIASGPNSPIVVDLLFNTVGHLPDNLRYRQYITAVICENFEVRNRLEVEGWREEEIYFAESGVDLSLYKGTDRRVARTSLSLGSDQLVITWFGRFSVEKDPLLFLEIAKHFAENKSVVFLMAGSGPLQDVIEKEIQKCKDKLPHFRFLGFVDNINQIILASDIFVLTSELDGRPFALMEAMAAGLCCLASNVGAVPELLGNGTGFIIDPRTPSAFAEKIMELDKDKEILEKMKHAAQLYAQQHLDQRLMGKRYNEIFDKLVSNR